MKTKVKGKVLAILMSLAMAFTMMPMIGGAAYADSEVTDDGVKYIRNDDNTATVSGYTDDLTAVVEIPEKVNDCTVTKIGYDAFARCTSIESITIPKSVVEIDQFAFINSSLTSITFESESALKKIGGGAFDGCSNLTSITIPKSVEGIWETAFGNSSLTSITFEAGSVLETIGGNAFLNCTNLTSISIPVSVTQIHENAFKNTGLTSIVIPSGVTNIGSEAFKSDTLNTVYYAGTEEQWNEMTGRDYNWAGEQEVIRVVFLIVKAPVEKSFTYNGKEHEYVVDGAGYTLSGTTKATNAGSYTATATLDVCPDPNFEFKWDSGDTDPRTITWKIDKAANPLTIKAKTATVKYSKVKKKARTLAVGKVIAFTKKGQGKMTYTKASGNKKITINKTTGKVKVKKGLKKGTYKVKVKVQAAGNANYNASPVKTVTFKVKVK